MKAKRGPPVLVPSAEAPAPSTLLDTEDPAVRKAMLRHDLAFYCSQKLRGPKKAPYNGKFLIGRPHIIWSKLVRATKRACILAHRDGGKTYFFGFGYPIWMADTRPGTKGYIFSATKDQAIEKLEEIASEIENNPELAHLDGSEIPGCTWSKTKLEMPNGSVIYARGFGTKVRGAHPDWVVCDDVLNDEDATSLTIRRRNIKYFRSAVTNLAGTDATIIVIGTPFHQADLYAKLEENTEYIFRSYPAIDSNGEAFWPARWPLHELEKRRREILSVQFTREFLLKPVSDDTSLFPDHLFEGHPFEQMKLHLGMPWEYWDNLGVTIYQAVDFAIGANTGSDYFVIWTVGLDESGNRWLIDIDHEQGISYKAQKSRMNTKGQRYQPAIMLLEKNQMQAIYGQEMIEDTDLPIVTYTTGVEKHDLAKGVPALRMLLENKKYRCPRGNQEAVEMTDIWIDELHNISVVDGKVVSVGEHDDTVMASWLCEKAIEKGRQFAFSFGEQPGDKEAAMEIEAADVAEHERATARNQREEEQQESSVLFIDDDDAGGPFEGAPPADMLKGLF